MFLENPIIWLARNLIQAYTLIVLAYIITQVLVQFGYAQRRHRITVLIMQIGAAIVEPALRTIRRVVPPISNFDFSPIVLIFGLQFLLRLIVWVVVKLGLL